eukprot:TRINITY_DN13527_c0_g1_i1.p1 TRINITY_DN13527_c0_g1~~TRINITY_DN13527_c0_g1_i1.p1  ORF type:complete len:163 (-),score=45.64 TRINITY_DN13527_c0_g1_i1:34-522(-)
MGASQVKAGKTIKQALKNPDNVAAVQAAFSEIDVDNNGGLDKTEWTEFAKFVVDGDIKSIRKEMKKQMKEAKKAMKAMGMGGLSGMMDAVDPADAVRVEDIQSFVDELFDSVDVNDDGVVSLEEFTNFINNHEALVVAEMGGDSSTNGTAVEMDGNVECNQQ